MPREDVAILAKENRRVVTALGLAVLLPMTIFLSLQFGSFFRAERTAVEGAALDKVGRIMGTVETELERSRASARVLATIPSINERDWREADSRARDVLALNRDWRSVRLWDLGARLELSDTGRGYGPPRPLSGASLAILPAETEITITGIDPKCFCMKIFVPVVRAGRPAYMFIIDLDARAFQRLLMRAAPSTNLTAIVDRDGRFIARTLHYAQRVGQPASHYVRAAIRRGKTGFYSGTTLEGLESYTAFVTSDATGWSTHMAVNSSMVDGPQRLWRLATIIAAFLSVLLAFGLGWIGLRTLAAERRSNERLQQAQRLEAIGKLTGGIAHDFNNMLAIITGSLDLAKRRLESGNTDIARYVDNAMEGARRAADLTRRMLAFSKRQTLEPTTIDVNALIEGMRDLLARTLTENIRIECQFGRDVWPVHVDPGELENALLNLAVNARDAMPVGGILTISTSNTPLSGDNGDRVRITVTDTGTGMTAEVRAKAFEPFFSTKDIGKGTGLGLSQLYGFAHQSGGTAEIDSQPGQGTTVAILLPRSQAAAPPKVKAKAATAPGGKAGEVILVVEDDEDVRRLNVEALEELGYTVRDTADPRAALEQLEHDRTIALLFTDIMMPGMDGRALAMAARKINPKLKLLLTTGYERDDTPDLEDGKVLRKPYSFEQLAKCIRETLDG